MFTQFRPEAKFEFAPLLPLSFPCIMAAFDTPIKHKEICPVLCFVAGCDSHCASVKTKFRVVHHRQWDKFARAIRREPAWSLEDRAFVRKFVRSRQRLVGVVITRMDKDRTPSVLDFLRTLYSDHKHVRDDPDVVRFEALLGLARSVRV